MTLLVGLFGFLWASLNFCFYFSFLCFLGAEIFFFYSAPNPECGLVFGSIRSIYLLSVQRLQRTWGKQLKTRLA